MESNKDLMFHKLLLNESKRSRGMENDKNKSETSWRYYLNFKLPIKHNRHLHMRLKNPAVN